MTHTKRIERVLKNMIQTSKKDIKATQKMLRSL